MIFPLGQNVSHKNSYCVFCFFFLICNRFEMKIFVKKSKKTTKSGIKDFLVFFAYLLFEGSNLTALQKYYLKGCCLLRVLKSYSQKNLAYVSIVDSQTAVTETIIIDEKSRNTFFFPKNTKLDC